MNELHWIFKSILSLLLVATTAAMIGALTLAHARVQQVVMGLVIACAVSVLGLLIASVWVLL